MAVISTRGNAESVVATLVLATLYLLMKKRVVLAALAFGTAVHLKIYPIIYAVPIWFGIDHFMSNKPFKLRLFSLDRFNFGVHAAATFFVLTAMMYQLYGMEFLQETYLYHITRKDHRHNFSLYFLHMYTTTTIPSVLASFGPQVLLIVVLGIVLGDDLPLAFFLQTFGFVALNKVSTSQYFMWYLSMLPLVLAKSTFVSYHMRAGLALLLLWITGQALWLLFAFKLEHLGESRFVELWLCSIMFYVIQIAIIIAFIGTRVKEPIK